MRVGRPCPKPPELAGNPFVACDRCLVRRMCASVFLGYVSAAARRIQKTRACGGGVDRATGVCCSAHTRACSSFAGLRPSNSPFTSLRSTPRWLDPAPRVADRTSANSRCVRPWIWGDRWSEVKEEFVSRRLTKEDMSGIGYPKSKVHHGCRRHGCRPARSPKTHHNSAPQPCGKRSIGATQQCQTFKRQAAKATGHPAHAAPHRPCAARGPSPASAGV